MLNPKGSKTGCGGALQAPGRETGCSHRRLLNPKLSSAVGACALHGVQPHLPPTGASRAGARGAGCARWSTGTAPGAGAALLAPEPRGHRHVLPTRRVGSRHGSFTPRSAGHQPWSSCTPMSGEPPEPSAAVTVWCARCSRLQRREHRAAAPGTAMPGTHGSDARLPPWQCHPPPPFTASRVPTAPGCQPSPVPALGPSPTHAGCRQAAGRRAGRLQADALCLGLLQG